MAWEYPHDFVSDGGEWCAVCGASCLGHGTKEGDETALASISAAKRMTDTSVERARAALRRGAKLGSPIPPCSCFDEARPSRNCNGVCEDAVNHVAAAITEAERRGAEEMRERAAQELWMMGLDSVADRIRALSPDGGDRD